MPINQRDNIIELENVSFNYGLVVVLKDINLSIVRGSYVGIIGPNGSGKTTLLKVILGLFQPAAGTVKLFGQPIAKFHDWSKIGYVPQKVVNFDPLFPATVQEVVAMGRYGAAGLGRWLNRQDKTLIEQALRQVEMLEHRGRLIGDLSGGQQQRVFIARALAGEPEVILLDEPTVGVDIKAQEDFYALLKRLNRELDLTMVLVSHDIDVMVKEVTEVMCLNQTLVCHGNPLELIKGNYLEKLYGKNTRLIPHKH